MPRRPPELPPEDLTVWESVRATIKPLHDDARNVHMPERAPVKRPNRSDLTETMIVPSQPSLSWSGDMAAYTRGDKKRVKQGVLKPTASLDLHGFTVARAERAVLQFLARSYQDGHAWVEIITGHGRPSLYNSDAEQDERKGVLRRLLPEWLNQPACRVMIKRVLPAPNSRGGSVWVALQNET